MYDYQMFKTVLVKGFDKDEVIAYIQKQEDEHNQAVTDLEKEIKNRDKMIAELKGRIIQKDEQREHLENEIETKYKKYIDNYDKIGSLIYESQIKGDKIVTDAKAQADKIISDARSKSEQMLSQASAEARNRVDSVQDEVDAKLADGKRKYLAVQDEMNEIVELINQAQRKFMQSYKEVHEIIQNMPTSMRDIDVNAEPGDSDADQEEMDEEDPAESFETGELNFSTEKLGLDDEDEESAADSEALQEEDPGEDPEENPEEGTEEVSEANPDTDSEDTLEDEDNLILDGVNSGDFQFSDESETDSEEINIGEEVRRAIDGEKAEKNG